MPLNKRERGDAYKGILATRLNWCAVIRRWSTSIGALMRRWDRALQIRYVRQPPGGPPPACERGGEAE